MKYHVKMKDLISKGDLKTDKDGNPAFDFDAVVIPDNAVAISAFHRHDWVIASLLWLEPVEE